MYLSRSVSPSWSVCLYICMSFSLYVYVSFSKYIVYTFFTCSLYLCMFLFVCFFLCQSICLFMALFSIYLWLHVYLFLCLCPPTSFFIALYFFTSSFYFRFSAFLLRLVVSLCLYPGLLIPTLISSLISSFFLRLSTSSLSAFVLYIFLFLFLLSFTHFMLCLPLILSVCLPLLLSFSFPSFSYSFPLFHYSLFYDTFRFRHFLFVHVTSSHSRAFFQLCCIILLLNIFLFIF